MLRLRIVLEFMVDEATPCTKAELEGYLKAMVQYQSLGVGLGSRNLESLGFGGVRLLEATFEVPPSAGERVVSDGQRAEGGSDPVERRGSASMEPTDGSEGKEGTRV